MLSAIRIAVAVVHDDPVTRAGLSAAVASLSDMELRGGDRHEASHWQEGAFQSMPDVLIVDYDNGIRLADSFAGVASAPNLLVIAAMDRECEIRTALANGIRGYLLAGCSFDDIAAGVRAVHRGLRHICPRAAARLAESFALEPLTAREQDVLRLLVDGQCNKLIGRELGISVGTVKSHLKSAFEKLDVDSRTQAIATIERRGLLESAASSRRLARKVTVLHGIAA